MPRATDTTAASQATVEAVQPLTWMRALRDDRESRGSTQHVLVMLGLRMDGRSGTGFCSIHQLQADCQASDSTIRRALTWAQDHGWLERTRRGHRRGDGKAVASEWRLTLPISTDGLIGRQTVTDDQLRHTQPVTDDQLNRPEPVNPQVSTGQTGHLNRSPEQYQEVLSKGTSSSSRDDQMMMMIEKCPPADLAALVSVIKNLRPDWDRDGIITALQRHLRGLTVGEAIEVARVAANDSQAQTPASFGWHRDRRREHPTTAAPACAHCGRPEKQCQQVQDKTGDRHEFQPDAQIGAKS